MLMYSYELINHAISCSQEVMLLDPIDTLPTPDPLNGQKSLKARRDHGRVFRGEYVSG
jgi:hypothetical protein